MDRTSEWRILDAKRKEQKISLDTVCSTVGIKEYLYGFYLKGKKTPTPIQLIKFYKVFGIDKKNEGVKQLEFINRMIVQKGMSKVQFWKSIGQRANHIYGMISNNRNVSFELILIAYDALGMNFKVTNHADEVVSIIKCSPFKDIKEV